MQGAKRRLQNFPGISWVAVIDDDEIADPEWLERMCAASERFGADIVGGPQMPVFPDNSDKRFTEPSGVRCRTTATTGRSPRSIRPATC